MRVTKWIDWAPFKEYDGKEFIYDLPYKVVTGYCGIDHISFNEYEEIRQAVINELRENGYHFSGNEHQYADHCVPVIDDKYALQASFREWGAIMEDAYPDEDYSDFHKGCGYCKWAFISYDKFGKDIKLPDQSRGVHDYDLEEDEE